jgi:hypothetical protein
VLNASSLDDDRRKLKGQTKKMVKDNLTGAQKQAIQREQMQQQAGGVGLF